MYKWRYKVEDNIYIVATSDIEKNKWYWEEQVILGSCVMRWQLCYIPPLNEIRLRRICQQRTVNLTQPNTTGLQHNTTRWQTTTKHQRKRNTRKQTSKRHNSKPTNQSKQKKIQKKWQYTVSAHCKRRNEQQILKETRVIPERITNNKKK